jgi:hypothetical protein
MLIKSVNLVITDRCNRACPECCCGVPDIKNNWCISLKDMVDASKMMYGIDRVNLTGGEASMHPEFALFGPLLKDMFGCRMLTIETNGFLFKKNPEAFDCFDKVYATLYDKPEFEHSNKEDIEFLKKRLGDKLQVIKISHVSKSIKHGTKKCDRGRYETVSLYKNRLYPCCVAWGISVDASIPLTSTWRDNIVKVHPPCKECFFAE